MTFFAFIILKNNVTTIAWQHRCQRNLFLKKWMISENQSQNCCSTGLRFGGIGVVAALSNEYWENSKYHRNIHFLKIKFVCFLPTGFASGANCQSATNEWNNNYQIRFSIIVQVMNIYHEQLDHRQQRSTNIKSVQRKKIIDGQLLSRFCSKLTSASS